MRPNEQNQVPASGFHASGVLAWAFPSLVDHGSMSCLRSIEQLNAACTARHARYPQRKAHCWGDPMLGSHVRFKTGHNLCLGCGAEWIYIGMMLCPLDATAERTR